MMWVLFSTHYSYGTKAERLKATNESDANKEVVAIFNSKIATTKEERISDIDELTDSLEVSEWFIPLEVAE